MPTIQWCSKWSLPFSASCNCWRFSSVSHRSSQAPTMPRRDWDRTFMIRMKHQVQTHRLLEPFALIHPQHPKPDDGRLLWMSGWCPGILRQRSKIYQIKNPDRIKKIYDVSICVNTCDPTENLGAIGAIGWFSSQVAGQSWLPSPTWCRRQALCHHGRSCWSSRNIKQRPFSILDHVWDPKFGCRIFRPS